MATGLSVHAIVAALGLGVLISQGAIYIAIATAVHASIVLLASRLRPMLIGGAYQKSIRRILSLAGRCVTGLVDTPDMTGSLSD